MLLLPHAKMSTIALTSHFTKGFSIIIIIIVQTVSLKVSFKPSDRFSRTFRCQEKTFLHMNSSEQITMPYPGKIKYNSTIPHKIKGPKHIHHNHYSWWPNTFSSQRNVWHTHGHATIKLQIIKMKLRILCQQQYWLIACYNIRINVISII